ncbi:hypothetical protein ACFWSF_19035 [Streptomyces sp. NPDC058611]|uniref:hypothetical protein n=1 Tax=unclassified Streptomyces TaxID=2593676 RepID=UPI003667D433
MEVHDDELPNGPLVAELRGHLPASPLLEGLNPVLRGLLDLTLRSIGIGRERLQLVGPAVGQPPDQA